MAILSRSSATRSSSMSLILTSPRIGHSFGSFTLARALEHDLTGDEAPSLPHEQGLISLDHRTALRRIEAIAPGFDALEAQFRDPVKWFRIGGKAFKHDILDVAPQRRVMLCRQRRVNPFPVRCELFVREVR